MGNIESVHVKNNYSVDTWQYLASNSFVNDFIKSTYDGQIYTLSMRISDIISIDDLLRKMSSYLLTKDESISIFEVEEILYKKKSFI